MNARSPTKTAWRSAVERASMLERATRASTIRMETFASFLHNRTNDSLHSPAFRLGGTCTCNAGFRTPERACTAPSILGVTPAQGPSGVLAQFFADRHPSRLTQLGDTHSIFLLIIGRLVAGDHGAFPRVFRLPFLLQGWEYFENLQNSKTSYSDSGGEIQIRRKGYKSRGNGCLSKPSRFPKNQRVFNKLPYLSLYSGNDSCAGSKLEIRVRVGWLFALGGRALRYIYPVTTGANLSATTTISAWHIT